MSVTFRVLSDDEQADYALVSRLDAIEVAWNRWREASCVEWNGGHRWSLLIDCGQASLTCAGGCGAEPVPDASEFLVGEFPVRVNVVEQRYRGLEHDEWDLWVEVEPA